MSKRLQISKEVSKYLFLSNLVQSNDETIESVIFNLKTNVKNKAKQRLAYLDTLEYKLKYIRNRNITKEIEERKLRKK